MKHLLIEGTSHAVTVRRGLRKASWRQDPSATSVHVREAESQRRCDEGYQDGARPEEGADEIEAVIQPSGWGVEVHVLA